MKQLLANKWLRFGLTATIYTLWFVIWTENAWWLLGLPFIFDYFITRKIHTLVLDKYRAYKESHRAFKSLMEWIEALAFAMVVVIPLKLYIFNLYQIPTGSMENSLMTGDFILVDRTAYGPKMPITPISFPFVHNTMPMSDTKLSYSDAVQFEYKRLKGYSKPKAGDVVVFNYPEGDTVALADPTASYYDLVRGYGADVIRAKSEIVYRPVDKRENYVKRCVAIAGDSLHVRGDSVFVNGIASPVPPHALVAPDAQQVGGEMIFPHDPENYPWSQKNFGPLWIPKAGATIALTLENLPLYQRVIKNYERHDLLVKDNTIYIDGVKAEKYTFAMDYFFMMGDNRDNSLDSRFWGFVPEDHIEGKAVLVWLSIEPGKNLFTGIRWSRMFNSIESY